MIDRIMYYKAQLKGQYCVLGKGEGVERIHRTH